MDSAVGRYFDGEVQEYVREREAQHSFRSQKALVLEMLGAARGRALDVGCGPALMAPALIERGFEVWGIDASERMIEAGRARMAGQRCHLALGDAERLNFPAGFFDAAICMGVLEYLADYRPALRELHRVVKPGGVAVLTVPNGVSPYHLPSKIRKTRSPKTNRCVPFLLDRTCEETGWVKEEGRGCNFIFFPLHDLSPAGSAALNRRLDPLIRTPLGVALGSQYVLKLRKP